MFYRILSSGITLKRARWFTLLPIPMLAAAATMPATTTLQLHVSGMGQQQAPLIVLLFEQDGWLHDEQAIRRLRIPADRHDHSWSGSIAGIPRPGPYAIEAFLDLNGNGKLDMHWFPVPGPDEPAGFSNHYIPFAKPSFDKASFELHTASISLTIRLR